MNLPSDEVSVKPAHEALRVGVPAVEWVLRRQSFKKWLTHGALLSIQGAVVVLYVLKGSGGGGGGLNLGPLLAAVAFVYFCLYAAVTSVPVTFLKTIPQVLLFNSVAPVLGLLAALNFFHSQNGPRQAPAVPPAVAIAPVPRPPPAPPPAKPRARAAPGWEQSSMLASFSVEEAGAAFRLRYVPHFTGSLTVRAGHPQLFDVIYGSATCKAEAEEPAECLLGLSQPQSPSGLRYELSAVPDDGSNPFGGRVTVDASGTGRPR